MVDTFAVKLQGGRWNGLQVSLSESSGLLV